MRIGKLNQLKVAKLVREAKPGRTGDGGGLYLAISAYGTPSWVFRYRTAGKLRDMGMGSADTWSLPQARERARELRQIRAKGRDPIDERRAGRQRAALETAKAMSFRDCATAYIAAHRPGWKSAKHAAQWPSSLEEYVFPVFGKLPVTAIDTSLVMRAIEPIWAAKTETASRVRGRVECILDWAKARGHRQGENPARWKGHLENLLPARTKAKAAARRETGRAEHHAALPYGEIAQFMVELRQQEGFAARSIEFAILTASRSGEALGCTWPEIDRKARLWTIAGDRMKGGKEHRVPLSDAAMAIVEEMAAIRQGAHVFAGAKAGRPLSSKTLLVLLRRMGRGDLTVHGFRSTFSDWCAEATNFSAEVRELALAHAVGSKVEAAYRRGDLFEKRRALAESWARYCAEGEPEGRVVALAAGRAR
jgi:integrase